MSRSYSVDIYCDEPRLGRVACDRYIASSGHDNVRDCDEEVDARAETLGWRVIEGKSFCPKCLARRNEEARA